MSDSHVIPRTWPTGLTNAHSRSTRIGKRSATIRWDPSACGSNVTLPLSDWTGIKTPLFPRQLYRGLAIVAQRFRTGPPRVCHSQTVRARERVSWRGES